MSSYDDIIVELMKFDKTKKLKTYKNLSLQSEDIHSKLREISESNISSTEYEKVSKVVVCDSDEQVKLGNFICRKKTGKHEYDVLLDREAATESVEFFDDLKTNLNPDGSLSAVIGMTANCVCDDEECENVVFATISGEYVSQGSSVVLSMFLDAVPSGEILISQNGEIATIKCEGLASHPSEGMDVLVFGVKYYIDDSRQAETYNLTGGIRLNKNCTIKFEAWADNMKIGSSRTFEITDVDESTPTIALTTNPTNLNVLAQSVLIFAAMDKAGIIEYKFDDDIDFSEYPESGVTATNNGIYYFKATDELGHVGYESITLNNILGDEDVNIELSESGWTNQSITLWKRKWVDGSFFKKYKIGNGAWQTYDVNAGITISENCTVVFQGTTANGKLADDTQYEVTNIDKSKPMIESVTVLHDRNDIPKNGYYKWAILSAVASDAESETSGLTFYAWKEGDDEPSSDAGLDLDTGFIATSSGTYNIKVVDEAGNSSEVRSVTVEDVDSEGPVSSAFTVAPSEWTSGNVIISNVQFIDSQSGLDDDGKIYYICGDSTATPSEYQDSGVEVTENCIIKFKAFDKLGNEGSFDVKIENIDKTAPTLDIVYDEAMTKGPLEVNLEAVDDQSGVKYYYIFDESESVWIQQTTSLFPIWKNGHVDFKVEDNVGNSREASVNISNISSRPIIETASKGSLKPITIMVTIDDPEADLHYVFKRPLEDDVIVDLMHDADILNKEVTNSNITYFITARKNGTYQFSAGKQYNGKYILDEVYQKQVEVTEYDEESPVIDIIINPETPAETVAIEASTEPGVAIYYNDVAPDYTREWTEYVGRFTVDHNGTWYFKAVDAAGNVGTKVVTISNIDTDAPEIVLDGDTYSSVPATILTARTESGVDIYWSIDNKTWNLYEGYISVTRNGTWYFKATDDAGHIGTAQITFSNIVQGVVPVITLKGNNVTVTSATTLAASVDQAAATLYWSTDRENWTKYESSLTIDHNGTWYFKAVDANGGIGTAQMTFSNIQTEEPSEDSPIITLTADTSTWCRSTTLAASVEGDEIGLEWSNDESNWTAYSSPLTVESNATYYFRTTGSEIVGSASMTFSNIDSEGPTIGISRSPSGATSGPVIVTATVSDTQSGVDVSTIRYKLGSGGSWRNCERNPYVYEFTSNDSIEFKASDNAGNETRSENMIVDNIVEPAPQETPAAPTVTASPTAPTNGDVTLTIAWPEGASDKMYKMGSGSWTSTNDDSIAVSDNTTIQFKYSLDGVESEVRIITVSNIDKEAPVLSNIQLSPSKQTTGPVTVTVDCNDPAATITYSINGEGSFTYNESVQVSSNGLITFTATDPAGNSGTLSYEVTNIENDTPEPVPVEWEYCWRDPYEFEICGEKNIIPILKVTLSLNYRYSFRLQNAVGSSETMKLTDLEGNDIFVFTGDNSFNPAQSSEYLLVIEGSNISRTSNGESPTGYGSVITTQEAIHYVITCHLDTDKSQIEVGETFNLSFSFSINAPTNGIRSYDISFDFGSLVTPGTIERYDLIYEPRGTWEGTQMKRLAGSISPTGQYDTNVGCNNIPTKVVDVQFTAIAPGEVRINIIDILIAIRGMTSNDERVTLVTENDVVINIAGEESAPTYVEWNDLSTPFEVGMYSDGEEDFIVVPHLKVSLLANHEYDFRFQNGVPGEIEYKQITDMEGNNLGELPFTPSEDGDYILEIDGSNIYTNPPAGLENYDGYNQINAIITELSPEEPGGGDEPSDTDSWTFTFKRYGFDESDDYSTDHPLSDGTMTFTPTGGTSEGQPVYASEYDGNTWYMYQIYLYDHYYWIIYEYQTMDTEEFDNDRYWYHTATGSSTALQDNWIFSESEALFSDYGYKDGVLTEGSSGGG